LFQNPKRSVGLVDIYRDDLRVRKWTTRLVLGMSELSLLKSLTQQMLTYKVKTAAIQQTMHRWRRNMGHKITHRI
jgi:hypothetical protein